MLGSLSSFKLVIVVLVAALQQNCNRHWNFKLLCMLFRLQEGQLRCDLRLCQSYSCYWEAVYCTEWLRSAKIQPVGNLQSSEVILILKACNGIGMKFEVKLKVLQGRRRVAEEEFCNFYESSSKLRTQPRWACKHLEPCPKPQWIITLYIKSLNLQIIRITKLFLLLYIET